ncbi:MAG: polysaccharide biosynthesis protein, partial [Clostridia bacterium]|nr:polysaccharide biosynthesis protein [Clostridia bacterium]
MNFKNIKFKKAMMVVYDIIFINIAYIISFIVEKANVDPLNYFIRSIFLSVVFLLLYWSFGIYKSMWEYAGSKELLNIGIATVLGGLVSISIDIVMSYMDMSCVDRGFFSATFYIYGTLMALVLVCAMRVGYRSVRRSVNGFKITRKKTERIMIVGAGDMGMIIIKELEAGNYRKGRPIVAVDDNPLKLGQNIRGVPVKGNCNDIPALADKYRIDTIVICIPSASSERQAEILHIAVSTGCHLKISPSLLEMVEDSGSGIRDVNITDLLSRPEVKLDTKICSYLTGKNILVTGGGGSIGSELCRQISKYSPSKIIIFDIYENNAFVLKNQLDRYYGGDPEIVIRIGSVRDVNRLKEIFDEFHPQVVFHAA